MADSKSKTSTKKKNSVIDPVYQKFTKSVVRAIGSMEFYNYFMDAIAHAENEIQFSNRRMEKWVDRAWVEKIEGGLAAFQKIIATPRNMIHEEELIVNVANAKKAGPDVVVHLAQHASLVEKFDARTGDVQPSRLMQKYREDSIGLYENRLVYTVLENAHHFVKLRNDALFSVMSDEFGAKLKVQTELTSATEQVHLDMFMHIKGIDSALDTDGKHINIFDRISRLYRVLTMYMQSDFAQQMAKLPRVKGAITKTNVLKKNPNYKAIVQLGEFLNEYDDIGYAVRVVEQNPVVSEEFQEDIFRNVLFNYLVLKGYLEREQDRMMPVPLKEKKRTLRPKFVKEIIEELTEDYDLPEVEIRRVLIEELTKEQLMQEEAAERRRLVEEQEKRKKEEEERLRQEQINREIEDTIRSKALRKELRYFAENLKKNLKAREEAASKKAAQLKEFEDAAKLLEEAEQRKQEAEEREKKRIREERERIRREKQLAIERARREEEERLERQRQAQLAEEERLRREEEERQEKLRVAEEERQAQLRREQDARDTAATAIYLDQVTIFLNALPQRLQLRQEEQQRVQEEKQEREMQRQRRQLFRGLFRK